MVPVRGSVDTSELLPGEDLGAIVEEAAQIAVVDCPCRWLRVQQGECDKPTFTCFSFTPNAVKYIVDGGIGRKISVDEAYEILDQCAEAGLIAGPVGIPGQIRALCNCCIDCCISWYAVRKYEFPGNEPGRFRAVVDQELCKGCQVCVERCPFGAVEMGKVPGTKKLKASVDPEKCYGCGVCVIKCPTKAQALKLRTVEPILAST